jgi:cytosine/adenosine deaminase-related metal-dependent hydrolase
MPRNLIHADAIADHLGVLASPGAILLDGDQIISVGSVQEIGGVGDATLTQIHGTVVPSLVNAHTHLDLSGIGIKPPKDSFVQWVEEDVLPIRFGSDESTIRAATNRGVELLMAGGTSIVGDIAGSMCAAEIVAASPLLGTVFIEILGQGEKQESAIKHMQQIPPTMGVQPHAPYSCSEDVYRAAVDSGLPVATHLAETPEELQYTMDASGPLVDLGKRLGAWDETVAKWNAHPIDAMIRIVGGARLLAAHLNYVEDRHLPMLAASNITAVYCPRASAYFGHEGHRWKEMIDAGVNVALGTDSLLCLDTPDRISVIDEMRFLHRTQDADSKTLFAMATVHGAIGLDVDPNLVTLSEGKTAGLIAFDETGDDPLVAILQSTSSPKWVFQPLFLPA